MGECVLSTTAINYKVLGLHVLIRGINVSSFPPHTPPFASINAAGEGKSVRASERKREIERETVLCFTWRRWEQAKDGEKQSRKKGSWAAQPCQPGKMEVYCGIWSQVCLHPLTKSNIHKEMSSSHWCTRTDLHRALTSTPSNTSEINCNGECESGFTKAIYEPCSHAGPKRWQRHIL